MFSDPLSEINNCMQNMISSVENCMKRKMPYIDLTRWTMTENKPEKQTKRKRGGKVSTSDLN